MPLTIDTRAAYAVNEQSFVLFVGWPTLVDLIIMAYCIDMFYTGLASGKEPLFQMFPGHCWDFWSQEVLESFGLGQNLCKEYQVACIPSNVVAVAVCVGWGGVGVPVLWGLNNICWVLR